MDFLGRLKGAEDSDLVVMPVLKTPQPYIRAFWMPLRSSSPMFRDGYRALRISLRREHIRAVG